MIDNPPFNITRRSFTASMVGSVFMLGFAGRLIADLSSVDQADGVLHMRSDGSIILYSGGGHVAPYAEQDIVKMLSKVLRRSGDDIVVAVGDNPAQLPALLAQNIDHLSFASITTVKHAAKILASVSQDNLTIPNYVIEDGISHKTFEMIKAIEPEGIIVAVRQRA